MIYPITTTIKIITRKKKIFFMFYVESSMKFVFVVMKSLSSKMNYFVWLQSLSIFNSNALNWKLYILNWW
jgi:hypothetical protein